MKTRYHLVQEVPVPQILDDWWHILGHPIKLTLLRASLGVCCVPQLELGCWVRWNPEQGSPLLRPRAAAPLLSIFYFIVAHNSEFFGVFVVGFFFFP